jgi:hypothetical protein
MAPKESKCSQTSFVGSSDLTSRKLDLMVTIEQQRMQLRKAKKKEHWQK